MLSHNLVGEIIPVKNLTKNRQDEMFALMTRYYDGVSQKKFLTDLHEKQDVILLLDEQTKTLKGFSTLLLLEATIHGKKTLALYSGDTIIDAKYWGTPQLSLLWCKYVGNLMKIHPNTPLYWLLISKGFRTYRFLSVFFQNFYPSYDKIIPKHELEIMHRFAIAKFPDFNQTTGLIQSIQEKDRLKDRVSEIDDHRLRDPHVEYFQQRNPNWKRGDELVCIAPITFENFTKMAKRLFSRANQTNSSLVKKYA